MFFDGACSPNVNKERSGMNKQFDRRDTSLFFGLDKTVDRTEVVTNEVHDKNSVALDLKRILAGLEELKDRISTLEGTETTGLARNSLTYVDDVKFYNWLKSTYRDRISRRNFLVMSILLESRVGTLYSIYAFPKLKDGRFRSQAPVLRPGFRLQLHCDGYLCSNVID